MSPPILEIQNISKSFGLAQILNDVSVKISKGTIHALLGHNGSGKSTIIRILSGNHRPDDGDGRVLIRGESLPPGSASASHRLGLRFVHQDLAVIRAMNAIENLDLGSEAEGGRFGFVERRIRSAARTRARLARLGLNVDFDITKPLSKCRHVDRLAVAIARAMADLDADGVLVLDEPTAALPPHEVNALFGLVRGFVAEGGTVIYVTHRLDEILDYADAVTVLRDGEVVGTYQTDELTRQDLVGFTVGGERVDGAAPSDRAVVASPLQEAAGRGARTTKRNVPALEVRNLRTHVLAGLSVQVKPGEIVGIAGLTGSGREDVASALVGAIPADQESLVVAGETLRKVAPASALNAGLVMVPGNRQPGSRIREMTTCENFTLPVARPYKRGPFVRTRAEVESLGSWIAALSVRPRDPRRTFGTLSGGNQQKVILAKWLDTGPKVAVLDEPTAGVDAAARLAIYDVIRDAARLDVGILVCSSDIEDLVSLCSRVIALRSGTAIDEFSGEDVSEKVLLNAVFGADDPVPAEPTISHMHAPERSRA